MIIDVLNLILSPFIELVRWIIRKLKKPDPLTILKRRDELRTEFIENLPPPNEHGVQCDAIIRDLSRMDSYPDIESTDSGISSWFKVEVKGLYHRGVEVFIGAPQYIKRDARGNWCFTNDDVVEDTILAYPVGRIPFDLIAYVTWRGDEYYNCPHIYCRFKALRGQPYETIPFFGKSRDSSYLLEVDGFRPWDRKRGKWFARLKR